MKLFENSDRHFLAPGQLFMEKGDFAISTILGSCVAVILYDPLKKQGGMNHYLLPLWNGDGLALPRYGNIAIEKLLEKMISSGSKKIDLKAKIFGGASMFKQSQDSVNIGERNVLLAQDYLKKENIPIISSNTLGEQGRKIIFHSVSGKVLHKFIQKSS